MANRYWVGGTEFWDGTAGTKWAATSGGPGGETIPTSADDVFFDNLSTGIVTVSTTTANAKSINCTGFTGTITGTAAINVAGSITLVTEQTYTHTGNVTISGTGTLITAGKTFSGLIIDGTGITVSLGDALDTSTRSISITRGTFNTANYNINTTAFTSSNTNTRTINLGSSTLTIVTLDFTTSSNLTFNAGTSQINTTMFIGGFQGGGQIFYNVSLQDASSGTKNITGANTFNNLNVTTNFTVGIIQLTFNSPQTINGTLSTTGTAGNRRVWFRSSVYGLAETLTINGSTNLTDADFRDLYIVGTSAPISGTRIGNRGNCRGITFDTPKTVYWNLPGGGGWFATAWALSSGGSTSNNNFPLAQDTAIIDNAGLNTSATILLQGTIDAIASINLSTRTSAMTLDLSAANTWYGNLTLGSGVTISGTFTQTFSGGGTQTITSAGKTFTCPIVVDSYGGTVQLADALTTSNGLSVTNGTFDTKNYNVSLAGSFSSSNSNIRQIILGSSTLNTASFLITTSTGLTLSSGTSTINLISSGGPTFSGSGLTYYNVAFTSTSATAQTINYANTFNNLTCIAASSSMNEVVFNANQTINGTLTVTGTNAVSRVFLCSNTIGATRTITANAISANDCDFRDIILAGSAAGASPTRAGDCGGNSGINFPAAKTVYRVGGFTSWASIDSWALTSGGIGNTNNFPLAQDTAVINNDTAISGTLNNSFYNVGTIDFSNRTTALTFNFASSFVIYGSFILGSGVTLTSGSIQTFAGRGVMSLISAGKTITCGITINTPTGTFQLGDSIIMSDSQGITLTAGTFDANNYNLTTGSFTSTSNNNRRIVMGSGLWTLSGTGSSIWNISNASSLTFIKNTANILASGITTGSRTFVGGGLSYNKLTIGGVTGTGTFSFQGFNQFTELASIKTVAHTIAFGTTDQTFGKWTVTGSPGNVVTLTGTSTNNQIVGSATSGIDYLDMGSIGFAGISPGEFYAGPNSTGTAGGSTFRTAPPTPRTLYWVGGTGFWNDTARWSTSSGGPGGAALPTSLDDVIFDSASNATAYQSTLNFNAKVKSLTIDGPASGNLTLAGSSNLVVHDNITLPATGLTRSFIGNIILSGSTGGKTLTTNGVALNSLMFINGVGCGWSLGSALNNGQSLTLTNGSFDTANFTLTASSLLGDNSNSRAFFLGSSTANIAASFLLGSNSQQAETLDFNAGTSTILSNLTVNFQGAGKTFYDVALGGSDSTVSITGNNTFNNLTFNAMSISACRNISFGANQTINGTLSIPAGANATQRQFLRSDVVGATRTLNVAAFSGTDVDFRDITITGAAAPISGTRFGDCKGNSGITFPAPKTVYWNLAGGNNWNADAWAGTPGGSLGLNNFPLAQDTAIITSTVPNTGTTITINQPYNIGTIDMSQRTTNTVTLATGTVSPTFYGDWINGTGTTITGTNVLLFAGRGSQTITSAGKTFTQRFWMDLLTGSLNLADTFISLNTGGVFLLNSGTFNSNNYNVTIRGFSAAGLSTDSRTVNIGSGTWALSVPSTENNAWAVSAFPTTITGTGTIKLTSAFAKTFTGGNLNYSGITLDQGGAGTLTINGNNIFKNITNSYSGTGAATISLGNTSQTVTQWTATGEAGRVLTLAGTSEASPGRLVLSGSGKVTNLDYLNIQNIRAYSVNDTWYAGTNSINTGSLGWIFTNAPSTGSTSNMFFLT